MTTPAQEMRAAVTKLTCQHEHPVQPPHGSLERPGPCKHCGTAWETREPVPEWLREPLADAFSKMIPAIDSGSKCPPSVLRLRPRDHRGLAVTDAVLWLVIAAMCGAGWLTAEFFNRRDRRVDLLESYRLDLDDDEVLDRLDAELDHRAIRSIDDAYGRWAR